MLLSISVVQSSRDALTLSAALRGGGGAAEVVKLQHLELGMIFFFFISEKQTFDEGNYSEFTTCYFSLTKFFICRNGETLKWRKLESSPQFANKSSSLSILKADPRETDVNC